MPALPSVTGSGLDLPALVANLVNASRAPTAQRLNIAGSAVKAKLSAIGQIKSALTGLQTALERLGKHADNPARTARVADNAGFSASTSAGAAPGRYQVEVVQLAQAHKLASTAGYPAGHTFSGGSLTIAAGQGGDAPEQTIAIKPDASLSEIARAINDAFAGKGVSAAVVTADDGEHLTLTASESGGAHAVTITADGGSDLQALAADMQTKTKAQDAIVSVDGLRRSAGSNTVSDLIPGVTLNLTKAAPGESSNFDITTDTAALTSDAEAFVTAWNAATSLLKASSAYHPETGSAAVLSGDSLVRTLQRGLRDGVGSDLEDLRALGISLDKDGQMQLDAKTFEAAATAKPDALAQMFGHDGHYRTALGGMLKLNLDSVDGSLTLRSSTLDKQMKDYGKQLDQLDARMEKLAALYTAQFTAMETMITRMQGSANALGQLLAASGNA